MPRTLPETNPMFSRKPADLYAQPVESAFPFLAALINDFIIYSALSNGATETAVFLCIICAVEIALGVWIILRRSEICYWLITCHNVILLTFPFLLLSMLAIMSINGENLLSIIAAFFAPALILTAIVRIIRRYLKNTVYS